MIPNEQAVTVQHLLELTSQTVDNPQNDRAHQAWWTAIQNAAQDTLIEATSRVESTPVSTDRAAIVKARREAMISEIDRRNASNVVQTMKELDSSTAKLAWIGLVLSFIGGVAAFLQVVEVLKKFF